MSDLIKREDAIEMVHAFFGAEIDRELPNRDSDEYTLTPDELKRFDMLLGYNKCICIRLKVIPPENAVPVVRCKDCKYYEETDELVGTCLLVQAGASPDGFCAWAERGAE